MTSHIDIAHFILSRHVRKGDTVIDATCGNGNDTLHLANLALTPKTGLVYCFDIQEDAINATKNRLKSHPFFDRIVFSHSSHTNLPECTPSVIVYNLGYLPGGDPSLTTQTEETFFSLDKGLSLLKPGGALSITFYPGHPEGARELSHAQIWSESVRDQGFKIFIYNNFFDTYAPQLWIVKKPFQKMAAANI